MSSFDSQLTSLKTQIALTRQKLNRAWAASQTTDKAVLAAGAELDELCNEYERLIKKYQNKECQNAQRKKKQGITPENAGYFSGQ